MNWLDIALIIGLIGGAFMGLRIGLIRAGFTAAGITVGFLIVGQASDDLAGWLGRYTTNESLATVFGYAVTITVSTVVAVVAGMIVKKLVYALFLGWVDRLAGFALGLTASVVISAIAIVGIVNMVYSSEEPGDGQRASVLAQQEAQIKEILTESLEQSAIVPVFIDFIRPFPIGDLAFAPADFKVVVDHFKKQMN